MAPAAGSPPSRAGTTRGTLGLLVTAAAVKAACAGADGADTETSEALAAVLADAGPRVVEPALLDAAEALAALSAATIAWRDAQDADAPAAQEAARAAWITAMTAWQRVEVLQIGPAAASLSAVAGEDLRDSVYSWPTVNRCRVDQETVYGAWDDPDFFDTRLVNVTGLDALEVLLWSPAGENDCPSQVDINADGSWDALGVDGVQRARSAYAAALAAEAARVAEELRTAWSADGGGFGLQLAAAGSDGSPYESPEAGLDALSDALFYLETQTKDRKLGYAIGEGDCEGDSCLEQIESPLAGGSHTWIAINLSAFRALWTGGEGAGFDELLRASDEAELADRMLAALDAADAAAAALDAPLDVVVADDPARVEAVYAAVKGVTDLLRGDVATALFLQIPDEAAGDND